MTKYSFYRKHSRVQLTCDEPSLTQANFQDECNINFIMKKFEKTRTLDHLNEHQGDYGDFIGYPEYHESMNQVLAANDMFMTIPSKIRAEFHNNAEQFLQFAQNPENLDRMVEMGLATQRPQEPSKEAPKKMGASPPSTLEAAPETPDTGSD